MVVKTLTENPFSGYGTIVTGDRFIGRKPEIQKIRHRVLGEYYGNIAIMGMPRTGKTSLAWNALMSLKDTELQKKNIISFLYMADLSSSIDFYKQLALQFLDEFESDNNKSDLFAKLSEINNEIQNIKYSLQNDELQNNRFIIKNLIHKLFRIIKRSGYRAAFILDEFDHVSNIFDGSDFKYSGSWLHGLKLKYV